MAAGRCRSIFGIWSSLWRSLVLADRHVLRHPGTVGHRSGINRLDRCPACSVPGRPNLGFTGQATTSGTVVLRRIALVDLSSSTADIQWLSNLIASWSDRPVLAAHQVDRRESQPRTAQPLGLSFYRLVLGLYRLEPADGHLRHHHHRLGLGRHAPGCAGSAATSRARGARSSSRARDWKFLWRTIVPVIACAFIIPIPWVYRWYAHGSCRRSRWPSAAPTPTRATLTLRVNAFTCARAPSLPARRRPPACRPA